MNLSFPWIIPLSDFVCYTLNYFLRISYAYLLTIQLFVGYIHIDHNVERNCFTRSTRHIPHAVRNMLYTERTLFVDGYCSCDLFYIAQSAPLVFSNVLDPMHR